MHGFIDWPKEGQYQVDVKGSDDTVSVSILAKRLDARTVVPREFIDSDAGWASGCVMCNWSLDRAFYQTAQDRYNLKVFFPQMARQLKRRISKSTEAAPCVKKDQFESPAKIAKGPPDTGGSASSDCQVGSMFAQPVLPPSPSQDLGGVKDEGGDDE